MASLLCCGPKLAACGIVLSAWGVIMLKCRPSLPSSALSRDDGASREDDPLGSWERWLGHPIPTLVSVSPPHALFRVAESESRNHHLVLIMLGIFFNVHSAVLIEDVPFTEKDFENGPQNIYNLYEQVSYNCFIAAGLYLLLGGFSFCQVRLNKRKEYMVR
nr:ribonuclease kappa isoform X1 [Saimiri boliviensis boliviensis]